MLSFVVLLLVSSVNCDAKAQDLGYFKLKHAMDNNAGPQERLISGTMHLIFWLAEI